MILNYKNFLFYLFLIYPILGIANVPDFNLYLYKQKNGDKVINWSSVLNISKNQTSVEKINLINLSPYYVEKDIRNYSSADVIFSVRNNELTYKTKSINNNFSLVSYIINEENGCLKFSISIIDKQTFKIIRLSNQFCYANELINYPDRTFTYNTPVSNFTNDQNGYSYLFIFDNKQNNENKKGNL